MCVFAYWDDHGNPSVRPDTAGLRTVVNQYVQKAAFNKVEAQIYDLRKKAGITFLSKDWKDDEGQENPAALLAKADSLRDTGNTQGRKTTTGSLRPRFVHSRRNAGIPRACEDTHRKTDVQRGDQELS